MAGQSREALERLRSLVRQAEANGSLDRSLAESFWDIAGRSHEALTGGTNVNANANANGNGGAYGQPYAQQADEGREVSITLRVRGRVPGDATSAVENALSTLARNAGATVVPGSVRVRA